MGLRTLTGLDAGDLAAASAAAAPAMEDDRAARIGGVASVGPLAKADAFTATFHSITCNDTLWQGDRLTLMKESAELGAKYPLTGWSAIAQPCLSWKRPNLTMPTPTGKGVPPVLMVQSVNDPATPMEGASRAHNAFEGSRLLTVTGEGDHGVYASENPCVDDIVEAFIVDGAVPTGDLTCTGTALPKPGDAPKPEASRNNVLDRLAHLHRTVGSPRR